MESVCRLASYWNRIMCSSSIITKLPNYSTLEFFLPTVAVIRVWRLLVKLFVVAGLVVVSFGLRIVDLRVRIPLNINVMGTWVRIRGDLIWGQN